MIVIAAVIIQDFFNLLGNTGLCSNFVSCFPPSMDLHLNYCFHIELLMSIDKCGDYRKKTNGWKLNVLSMPGSQQGHWTHLTQGEARLTDQPFGDLQSMSSCTFAGCRVMLKSACWMQPAVHSRLHPHCWRPFPWLVPDFSTALCREGRP